MGVFSSVKAATISMSSESFPEICKRNPLLSEKSFVVPTVNPLINVPLFCIPGPNIASGVNPLPLISDTRIVSPILSSYLTTKLLRLYSLLSESLTVW